MEQKKSKEANLENKKAGFFLIGLVMISAIVGMAFEFKEFKPLGDGEEIVENRMEDDLVFDIPQDEEPPPEEDEVAPPPPPVIEPEIDVVDDDEEVEEYDFSDMDEPVDDVPDDPIDEPQAEEILDFVEVEPSFPGGAAEMARFIQDKVKYPELAKEMGEQGIVYVKFVVNKNGSIEQVKIAKGVSDALDAEAKRVVRSMPRWTPGEQAGKPVRVNFTLPIHFRIQ